MSKSYRRGGDDRFEARRRRNEQRSLKRDRFEDRDWGRGSLNHMPDNNSDPLYTVRGYRG